MNLYRNVQKACAEAGTPVARLEENLGFNRGTIAKWEQHVPGVDRVKAVADELGTTVDALLSEEG